MSELTIGMPAPDFELLDATGSKWSLSSLRGQKVILYFYPIDDTPGCTTEACDFRDAKTDFQEGGYVILGISPQGTGSKNAFADKYGLNFPLLIDEDMTVAERYGVKLDRPRSFKDMPVWIYRSTFVVDEQGNLAEALYGVKPQGHIEELKQRLL